jgi:hypothetical protein
VHLLATGDVFELLGAGGADKRLCAGHGHGVYQGGFAPRREGHS